VQLWRILNVKNPVKGKRLNDTFCDPVRSVDDHKLEWLKYFYSWLCAWENANVEQRQGILSKETMLALKHTVKAAVHLSEYLLTSLNFQFVLLGKFQTDNLEFRFGQYRQLSGANYNVSVTQIMESEKKLKIISLLKLVACDKTVITLKDFIVECQSEIDDIEQAAMLDSSSLSHFSGLDDDSIVISDAEMSGIVFIAGYVRFKLKAKLSCFDCRADLLTERALECEYPKDDSF